MQSNKISLKNITKKLEKIDHNVQSASKSNTKKRKHDNKRPAQLRTIAQLGDEPQRINHFRSLRGNQLIQELAHYNKHVKDRYLVGLVHPDIAVKEQIPVKLYSDVPIPTASIGWHEQYSFQVNATGNFLMSWRPNYLVTTPSMVATQTGYSHLTYNNNALLTGTAALGYNAFVNGAYIPNVDIQRYRLVSALLKVSYNGSHLAQAGTMISCATFDPLSSCNGTAANPPANYSDTLVDRFANFNLIRNGLWNETTNITANSEGLEHLYVPLDPNDYMFEKTNYYQGTVGTSNGLLAPSAEGAHIAYIIAGINLPASATCIMVDIYYNYEVIADPSAAPILRSAVDTVYNSKDKGQMMSTITDAARGGKLIKKSDPNKSWNLNSVLSDVARVGMKYIPQILAAL